MKTWGPYSLLKQTYLDSNMNTMAKKENLLKWNLREIGRDIWSSRQGGGEPEDIQVLKGSNWW